MAAGLVLLGSEAAVAEQITLKLSNGDTLSGTLVPSESTDTTTVLEHPVLGRSRGLRRTVVPAATYAKLSSTKTADADQ